MRINQECRHPRLQPIHLIEGIPVVAPLVLRNFTFPAYNEYVVGQASLRIETRAINARLERMQLATSTREILLTTLVS